MMVLQEKAHYKNKTRLLCIIIDDTFVCKDSGHNPFSERDFLNLLI